MATNSDPLAALASKSAQPASQPQQPQPVQSTPTAPTQDDDSDAGTQPDDAEMTVPLKRLYASLSEKLVALLDGSGIKRSLTVPYIHGGNAADHIGTVSKAVQQAGGLGANLILTYHDGNGRGWGSGDGRTVGYPADKLRATTIPKDDEKAEAVIDAAQKYLNGVKKLLGDKEPAVQVAQGQLNLVKKVNGAHMTLHDFATFMVQMSFAPMQAVARAHSGTKPDGHSVRLRPPHEPRAVAKGKR